MFFFAKIKTMPARCHDTSHVPGVSDKSSENCTHVLHIIVYFTSH